MARNSDNIFILTFKTYYKKHNRKRLENKKVQKRPNKKDSNREGIASYFAAIDIFSNSVLFLLTMES